MAVKQLKESTKEYLLRKCTCKKCGGHIEAWHIEALSYTQKGTFIEHKEGDCQKTTRI